jgi:hypothetical protein
MLVQSVSEGVPLARKRPFVAYDAVCGIQCRAARIAAAALRVRPAVPGFTRAFHSQTVVCDGYFKKIVLFSRLRVAAWPGGAALIAPISHGILL